MGIQILNCDPEIPLPSHSNASLSNIQCIGVCVCACCSLILPVFLRCYFSTCSEECWVWKCWKSQQFMQSLRALQRAQRQFQMSNGQEGLRGSWEWGLKFTFCLALCMFVLTFSVAGCVEAHFEINLRHLMQYRVLAACTPQSEVEWDQD